MSDPEANPIAGVLLSMVVTFVGAFLVYVALKLKDSSPYYSTLVNIKSAFPKAMTNEELIAMIKAALNEKYGFSEKSSLVATSLCCDEVNRPLEDDLSGLYNGGSGTSSSPNCTEHYFSFGGLAGVPHGGVTGFGAMASHIPDGGSCLVVYGPHVGVDADGKIGTVNRRGRTKGGTCCGSAIAAASYVAEEMKKSTPSKASVIDDPLDAQQQFINSMLLPHGQRLKSAVDAMVELPYALFDIQDELVEKIVEKGCGKVAGNGKVAMLGGIQINTPAGMSDYFLPLRFEVRENTGKVLEKFIEIPSRVTLSTIQTKFPCALSNAALGTKVSRVLEDYGYGKSSLLATSLCCDEVNRPLDQELQKYFGSHFNLGGLAGFSFSGVTGFCAMAAHIPDGGSCLVVYGPHVGVDSDGKVGTVNRLGRAHGGACCGSGVAAAVYVNSVYKGGPEATMPKDDAVLDAQQAFVGKMLLPHAKRLDQAEDGMAELPYALYDAQDELMSKIVQKACGKVAGDGKVALLGGIQINTPDGVSDYFLPLRFDLMNNQGKVVKKLSLD